MRSDWCQHPGRGSVCVCGGEPLSFAQHCFFPQIPACLDSKPQMDAALASRVLQIAAAQKLWGVKRKEQEDALERSLRNQTELGIPPVSLTVMPPRLHGLNHTRPSGAFGQFTFTQHSASLSTGESLLLKLLAWRVTPAPWKPQLSCHAGGRTGW